MQASNIVPLTLVKPITGHVPEVTSNAVPAVTEAKAAAPDSTTVNLSDEAKNRYAANEEENTVNADESPAKKAGEETVAKTESKAAGGSDSVAETLEHLQELLKEAQERLKVAQQQMTLAMAEMKGAADESQRMAAMMKVQAAQMTVISAQGEVLAIYNQINQILREQQKQQ